MTTIDRETTTSVDGKWDVAWMAMAPKVRATLTLTTDGDGSVSVNLDSPMGSHQANGSVDGRSIAWSMAVDTPENPWRFTVNVDGNQMVGTVSMGPFPMMTAALEGTRAGSRPVVTYRVGSDAFAESLGKCGVEYVFGYTGGASTSLERSIVAPEYGLKALAGRTELNAAWMSYGFNRVKRRAASAVSVWCVGAMHASPVVYAAKLDSTPLVFLAMEHATAWDFRDILQDSSDLYSALRPVSKYAKRLVNVEDVPVAVRQAVLAASTGKPGPAVLCLTYESMHGRTTMPSEALVLPSKPAATEEDVSATLQLIRQAKRPVLLAGAGVHIANATAELRKLAERLGVPVVTSGPESRGVLPDDHPLYAGDCTTWGGLATGLEVAQEADLWVSVGFSFAQHSTHSWTLKKPDKVVQVDVEENQLGRIFQPTLGIVADAKVFLKQLVAQVQAEGLDTAPYENDPRISDVQKAKSAYFAQLAARRNMDPIVPIAMGQVLSDEVPDGTLIVQDEGFQLSGMVFKESKYPAGFAPALGFHYASLGSTLPVAIGAKLAEPERTVISFGGDGGFFYDCSELATLAQNNIKLIVIINNNSGLYGGRRGRAVGMAGPFTDFSDSNFARVAQGFGVEAEQVKETHEFAPALRRALAADGPYLIDVISGGSNLPPMGPEYGFSIPPKFGHQDPVAHGSWPA